MASCAPTVPIDGDWVPVLVLGLSLVDPVVPGPIPLGLLPGLSGCCASTRGAATKTTARETMMVLLSLLIIDILLFLYHTLPSSPVLSTPAAWPYAAPAVGIVALRRPGHRESNFYAICNRQV